MKLYRLTVTYETVVAAESEAEAIYEGQHLVNSPGFDEEPEDVDATEITSLSELPPEWESDHIPWNQPNYVGKTVLEILNENKSCNP